MTDSTGTFTTTYGEQIPYEYELIEPSRALATTGINTSIPLTDNDNQMLFDDAYQIEFSGKVPVAEKRDYIIAVASGLISGAIDVLLDNNLSLENAREKGSEKASSFVVRCANKIGFKGTDLDGAIRFLEQLAPLAADRLTSEFGGGLQHHLRDFCHHPTIVGLAFSVLSQFTGLGYGTDKDGRFITPKLPDDALVGESTVEKIYYGAIQWIPHIISDLAGSSQTSGKGTGIPGPLLSLFKEIAAIPVVNKINVKYKGDLIPVSTYLSKLFNGTAIRTKDGTPLRFDLRTEIGLGMELSKMTFPVAINECIVRLSYFCLSINDRLRSVHTLLDAKVQIESSMPRMDRTLSRMLTVASGTLTAIDLGQAAAKAAIEVNKQSTQSSNDQETDNEGMALEFAIQMLARINYPGVVRFTIALCKDGAYLVEDLNHGAAINKGFGRGLLDNPFFFEMSDHGRALLFSFLVFKTKYDIEQTKNAQKKRRKEEWLQEFINCYGNGQQIEAVGSPQQQIASFTDFDTGVDSVGIDYMRSYYVLAVKSFIPYHVLHEDNPNKKANAKYRGLKCGSDYMHDKFLHYQSSVDEEFYDSLCAVYNYYYQQLVSNTDYNKRRHLTRRLRQFFFNPIALIGTEAIKIQNPSLMVSLLWGDEEQTINQLSIWLAICKEVVAKKYQDFGLINYLSFRLKATIKKYPINDPSLSFKEKNNNKILVSYLNKCIEELEKM